MFETNEKLTIESKDFSVRSNGDGPVVNKRHPSPHLPDRLEVEDTQKLSRIFPDPEISSVSPASASENPRRLPVTYKKRVPGGEHPPRFTNKQERLNIHLFQEQCRHLCLDLFGREQDAVRSLGFTSAISGEGKSFLALAAARLLARDSLEPVTLIECNWDHPTLHKMLGIPEIPGLAEWLNGSCDEQEIRYEAEENLTVIPAGDGAHDAVKLLKRIQQSGLQKLFKQNELLILDLPPVITTSYGSLAASLAETVVIVVRSEVTPSNILTETCAQLKDVSIHGIILNQGRSRIPRWLRQIL